MAVKIRRRNRGVSILFPLQPIRDESIYGYLARVADWNCFGKWDDLLEAAGLHFASRNVSNQIAAEISAVSAVLGVSGASLQRILQPTVGGDPEVVEYFGLPFQRRRFEFVARRVSPASLARSPYHRARWQIRLLPFCPESWEYLIDQCPSPTCGKALEWARCLQVDRCEHCEFDLTQARPGVVPLDLRDTLSFACDLVDPTPETKAKAIARLPIPFRDLTAYDLFEVLCVVARSLAPERDERAFSAEAATLYLALACRALLDYPATIERVAKEGSNEGDPRILPLFLKLRRRGKEKTGVQKALLLSMVDLAEVGHYGSVRTPRIQERDGEWTFDRSAAWLGISHSEFSEVIAAHLAQPLPRRVGARRIGWIAASEVHSLQISLRQYMTPAEFAQSYDLPLSGMEQLVSLGFLEPCTEPIVKLLYPGFQLDRTSVLRFVGQVAEVLGPPLPDSIALEDVFSGVGGREKPWGKVLEAALDGRMPGGLGAEMDARLRFQRLTVPRQFAEELLAERYPNLLEIPARSEIFGRLGDLSRIETQRYLNCSASDLAWLFTERYLFANPGRQSVPHAQVEAFGRDFISLREVSRRWRISNKAAEALLEKQGTVQTLGPFWARQAVEEHFSKLFASSPAYRGPSTRIEDMPDVAVARRGQS
jgi:hypothetical protein